MNIDLSSSQNCSDRFRTMYIFIKLCLFSSILVSVLNAAKLPATFKRCSSKDKECLKIAIGDAINKLAGGLKEFGMDTLDPIKIPEMTIGAGGRVVDVQQIYHNVNIFGYHTIKINDVELDMNKGILVLNAHCDMLDLKANYEVNGKILLLPVQGQGPAEIYLDKVNGTQSFKFQIITKNGQNYMKFIESNLTLTPYNVKFQFDNLFNGDKKLGDQINKVINDNWKDLFNEVVNGYEEVVALINMDFANKLFSKVPISEIFLD